MTRTLPLPAALRLESQVATAKRQDEVAVLIPAYNEEQTIAAVIEGFRKALPDCQIYVGDNNSTDRTAEIARAAGAQVRSESRQGKGYVVRRLFADVDADVYVMVDGDDTYDADAAPAMVRLCRQGPFDLVNGARVPSSALAYRPGHRFGNVLLTTLVATLFGHRCKDMLSGYKVLSRRFVKSFPVSSCGFEIETELLVHALELRVPIGELETEYRDRPEGSSSKLKTVRDGVRILLLIAHLVRQERPMQFFGSVGAALVLLSLALGVPLVTEFARTGQVPRQPTAILATGLAVSALLSFFSGLILASVTQVRRELKMIGYLRLSAIH